MDKTKIFTRTSLGDAEIDNPDGKITGDERRLILLADGKTSVAEIGRKIPPSVYSQLDDVFARLLSARFIVETGKAGIDTPLKDAGQDAEEAIQEAMPADQEFDRNESAIAGIDIERGIGLERVLAEVRAQLAARIAQLKDVVARNEKSRQKIAAHAQSMQAKLAEKMQVISVQGNTEELRANFANVLREFNDSVSLLNRMLVEQQENIEITLKLNAYKAQSNAIQQKEDEAETAKMARSHPHFNALLGLNFFKAFGNAELLHFLKIAKFQTVKAGETVLREGDVGLSFYIIVSGSLSVFKQGNLLASLEKGDFFGEFSHLSGEEPLRSAEVVAATACELLEIDPLDVEFASAQIRLNVAEAFLRGLVRRSLLSNQRISGLLGHMYTPET